MLCVSAMSVWDIVCPWCCVCPRYSLGLRRTDFGYIEFRIYCMLESWGWHYLTYVVCVPNTFCVSVTLSRTKMERFWIVWYQNAVLSRLVRESQDLHDLVGSVLFNDWLILIDFNLFICYFFRETKAMYLTFWVKWRWVFYHTIFGSR